MAAMNTATRYGVLVASIVLGASAISGCIPGLTTYSAEYDYPTGIATLSNVAFGSASPRVLVWPSVGALSVVARGTITTTARFDGADGHLDLTVRGPARGEGGAARVITAEMVGPAGESIPLGEEQGCTSYVEEQTIFRVAGRVDCSASKLETDAAQGGLVVEFAVSRE